jgi:choline dehydrogenase-like flavoprotein
VAAPSPHFPDGARALPFLDRTVQDFYLAEGAGLPHPKAGTILFMLPHVNPIFQAEKLAALDGRPPLFGAALQRRLREFFHDTRTVEWESLSEFHPHAGCDVTLDPEVKDRFGLRAARLRIGLHPASRAASDHLGRKATAILDAAGMRTGAAVDDERVYTVLQAGTARMGTDPARSVLDPNGRAHEVPNLYVVDGSGFPSSSGAPFTLTIMANALRVASRVVRAGRTSGL